MKTAIIYLDCGLLTYYILDGDYTKFNGIYINHSDSDPELEKELTALFYSSSDGSELQTPIDLDDFFLELRQGQCEALIECGFLA